MKDDVYYKRLGSYLQSIRKNKRLSLADVSERFNPPIAKSTLKRYEDGITRISMETLDRWCKALNVNSNFVFDYVKRDVDEQSRAEKQYEEQAEIYDKFYSYLTNDEKDMVEAVLYLTEEQAKIIKPLIMEMTKETRNTFNNLWAKFRN